MSYRALWQNRGFRLLFIASVGANLGDGVLAVALRWFATLLTRDPFLIGLVASAPGLPWLLFTLPIGVVTDRYDRKRLILLADGLRLILVGAAAVAAVAATPGLGAVLVLAGLTFVLGAVEVLRDNTGQSVLPLVVGPEHLERANGTLWSAEELTGRFIGPPLAGAMFGRVNSAYRFFGSGAMPLGAMAGGSIVALAAPLGAVALQLPFAIAAVGATGMMAYSLRFLRIG